VIADSILSGMSARGVKSIQIVTTQTGTALTNVQNCANLATNNFNTQMAMDSVDYEVCKKTKFDSVCKETTKPTS
jgi:hypothetical protein